MRRLFIYITLLVSCVTFGQHEMMLMASYQQANNSVPTPIYGITISDDGGSWVGSGGPEAVFDGNISTFRRANDAQYAWVGQDFGINRIINKVRVYPYNLFGEGIRLDGCTIQYSDDSENWIPLHTISGAVVDEWYEYSFTGIAARYWIIEGTLPASYGGDVAELEFYEE